MCQQIFVDREEDMASLIDRYRSPVPECLILYGKRLGQSVVFDP